MKKLAICIIEILTGKEYSYSVKNITNNMNPCNLIINHRLADQRIQWHEEDKEKIEYLFLLSLGLYEISDYSNKIPEIKLYENTCSICMNHPITAKFSCSHTFCMDCAKKTEECYICRKPVHDSLLGYWILDAV